MQFPTVRPTRALLAAALVAAFSSPVFGYTVSNGTYVTDGSQGDVSQALNDAPAGSIIKLPSGTFTWGANASRLWITKAVTLAGAGPANTTIDVSATGPSGQNALINLLAAAVVKDFSIQGSSAPVPVFSAGGASGWRITNITYTPATGVPSYFCLINGTYGLIDSCNITGAAGNNELIFGRGPSDSWQTPNSLGTVNNVFIENCVFNGPGYVCDANSNARFVVRFCTINGPMKIDGHGVASNTPARSVREMEIYDNTWTWNQPAFPAIEVRGGTGMIFDNSTINEPATSAWLFLTDYGYTSVWPNFGVPLTSTAVGNPGTFTTASTTTPFAINNGWLVNVESPNSSPALSHLVSYPATVVSSSNGSTIFTLPVDVTSPGTGGYVTRFQTPLDYPVNGQIGVGKDPKIGGSAPVYVWANQAAASAGAGTATQDWALRWKQIPAGAEATYQSEMGSPTASFTMQDVIKADRDYFKDVASFDGSTGVGIGTKAAMEAITPTKVGVGFWVTDEGDWNKLTPGPDGQLYVWNGTSWVLKYTPYTYPHPLRAPTAPSNLQLQLAP